LRGGPGLCYDFECAPSFRAIDSGPSRGWPSAGTEAIISGRVRSRTAPQQVGRRNAAECRPFFDRAQQPDDIPRVMATSATVMRQHDRLAGPVGPAITRCGIDPRSARNGSPDTSRPTERHGFCGIEKCSDSNRAARTGSADGSETSSRHTNDRETGPGYAGFGRQRQSENRVQVGDLADTPPGQTTAAVFHDLFVWGKPRTA